MPQAHTARIVTFHRSQGWTTITLDLTKKSVAVWARSVGYTVTGVKEQSSNPRMQFRAEMVGEPIIAELVGPMYDGDGVVRYESTEAYDALSR